MTGNEIILGMTKEDLEYQAERIYEAIMEGMQKVHESAFEPDIVRMTERNWRIMEYHPAVVFYHKWEGSPLRIDKPTICGLEIQFVKAPELCVEVLDSSQPFRENARVWIHIKTWK